MELTHETPPRVGDAHRPPPCSRRSFLRTAARSAAALAVLGDGILAYRAYDNGVVAAGLRSGLRGLAWVEGPPGPTGPGGAAVPAASAHNTRPWLPDVDGVVGAMSSVGDQSVLPACVISSWDAIQRHKDGLAIDGAGLPPVKRAIGKLLPIQRLHLWATAHQLGFQHMNQITERIDRDDQLGGTNPFQEAMRPSVLPRRAHSWPVLRSPIYPQPAGRRDRLTNATHQEVTS